MTSPRPRTATVEEQDQIREYLPLVHHVVTSIRGRLPNHVSADDLTSAAMLGLLHAVRGFDDRRGVPFASYAKTRIHGAVLDELRGGDWATRSLRAKSRALQEARERTGAALEEAAAAAGLSVEEARRVQADVERASVLSVEGIVQDQAASGLPLEEATPEAALEDRERTGYLRDAVDLLPERLRHVVVGIFFDERSPAELATELGVTESRISHMRAEAMGLLRDAMATAWWSAEEAVDPAPVGVAARRRAAYFDAVRAASDPRSRLDREAPVRLPVPA